MKEKLFYLTAALLFAITVSLTSCSDDDDNEKKGTLPAAAGEITQAVQDDGTVILTVAPIENAQTYRWYKDGAVVQDNSEPTYTATASGKYKVAGVNETDEGPASTEVDVTVEDAVNILTSDCFPDPALLQFVKDSIAGGADTYTNIQAAQYTGKLLLDNNEIKDIKGIEYFKGITEFCAMGLNQLLEANLSANQNLHKIEIYGCTNLEQLNISGLAKVDSITVQRSKISALDLSAMQQSLIYLYITGSNLTAIDIKQCVNLEYVNVRTNDIQSLDASGLAKLKFLDCDYECPDSYYDGLKELNVNGCTSLEELNCSSNQLMSLDLSTNTKIINLYIQNNYGLGGNIDISHLMPQMVNLNCANTGMTHLDLSQSQKLVMLEIQGNAFSEMPDFSNLPNITHLRLEENNFSGTLSILNSPKLGELYCYTNDFSYIDISGCSDNLWNFVCFGNNDLKQIKVWPTFDMDNPTIKAPQGVELVYEFTE